MHTPTRKKEGEVKLFIIGVMLQDPTSNWQTNDFLPLVKNRFSISQRQTVIRHLKQLSSWGLIRYNPSAQSYKLPENYKTHDYVRKLYAVFDIKMDSLLLFYPIEVQRQYYSNIITEAKEKIKGKYERRRLNIESRRETELAYGLLYSVEETYLDAMLLLDTIEDKKQKAEANALLDKFNSCLKRNLVDQSIGKLQDKLKNKRLPRFIRPKLKETITRIESE